MKVTFRWERATEGVSTAEVDEQAVMEWLNDPLTGGPEAGTWTLEKITQKECVEFLQSGDADAWEDYIDHERDESLLPWSGYELKGLADV